MTGETHPFTPDKAETEPLPIRAGVVTIPKSELAGTEPEPNQDYALSRPNSGVFVVADGLAGESFGDTASEICAETFADSAEWSLQRSIVRREGRGDPSAWKMKVALANADKKLRDKKEELGTEAGATTLVAAIKTGIRNRDGLEQWAFVNAGDSTSFLLRNGELTQITEEQNSEMEPSKVTNVLSGKPEERDSYQGMDSEQHDQVELLYLEPGDRILLASDGLTGDERKQRVAHETITEVMQQYPDDPQACAEALAHLPEELEARGDYTYQGLEQDLETYKQEMQKYNENLTEYKEKVRTGKTDSTDEQGRTRYAVKPIEPIKPTFQAKVDDRTVIVIDPYPESSSSEPEPYSPAPLIKETTATEETQPELAASSQGEAHLSDEELKAKMDEAINEWAAEHPDDLEDDDEEKPGLNNIKRLRMLASPKLEGTKVEEMLQWLFEDESILSEFNLNNQMNIEPGSEEPDPIYNPDEIFERIEFSVAEQQNSPKPNAEDEAYSSIKSMAELLNEYTENDQDLQLAAFKIALDFVLKGYDAQTAEYNDEGEFARWRSDYTVHDNPEFDERLKPVFEIARLQNQNNREGESS